MTGLPKKDWFQLGEVASRWNRSADDLLHYAWQDQLRVSVVFVNPTRVEWSDIDAVRDITLEDGPLALVSDAFLHAKPKGGFSPWSLRPPVLGENDLWGKPVEGGPWSADQPKIRQRDLIIAREEVERFERLHGIDVRPSNAIAHLSASPQGRAVSPSRTTHRIAKRTHFLAALIRAAQESAVQSGDEAARWDAGAVWAVLREMALEERAPFRGADASGLSYTGAQNSPKVFSKGALSAYLKRQRKTDAN